MQIIPFEFKLTDAKSVIYDEYNVNEYAYFSWDTWDFIM